MSKIVLLVTVTYNRGQNHLRHSIKTFLNLWLFLTVRRNNLLCPPPPLPPSTPQNNVGRFIRILRMQSTMNGGGKGEVF